MKLGEFGAICDEGTKAVDEGTKAVNKQVSLEF